MDTIQQIQSHLLAHQYEGLIEKSQLRGRKRSKKRDTETMNIILLGPPGAGKGTQARRLVEERGMVQLSPGTCCATRAPRGTDMGKKVAAIMDAGQLGDRRDRDRADRRENPQRQCRWVYL